jgi:hypothetical protein
VVGLLHSLRVGVQRRIGRGAALSVGFVLVGTGVVVASIPDSSGVINGCYNKATGMLRVIDTSTDNCRPNEVAISWNQTGPQGPPGPKGPAGPQGPPGSVGIAAYAVPSFVCGAGHDGGTTDASLRRGSGLISGTFDAGLTPPPGFGCGGGFTMFQTFTFQNVSGPGRPFAVGTGTATCDVCTVGGRTGAVSFALTVVGLGQFDSSGNLVLTADGIGGTWTIVGASGGLSGLTGQGTYDSRDVFIGRIVMPS